MQSINIFHSGINTDNDYSKRDNQSWDFPTLNARIFTRDGQGYIITNIDGNDFDLSNPEDTVGIELAQGFCPIGACELNGIAYILSWNEIMGQGELGSYPSPAGIIDIDPITPIVTINDASGFKRRYRPLVNFNDNTNRYPFRTAKFTLDIDNMADMFAMTSYDGSVDIFIADGVNLNRCINSGFNSKGELLTTRFYNEDSFPFFVSHIPLTNKIPNTESVNVPEGGIVKSGNYFFYIKYVTESFNRTHVLHEIGPIAILAGDKNDKFSVQGIRGDGGDSGEENCSTKKIAIKLNNIDPQYKYVEVISVRHWSDSTGVVVDDINVIDKLFQIDGTTVDIIITGHELLLSGAVEDILNPAPKDLISKTHTIIDNRYFGANWKRYVVHNDKLSELAKRFVPSYNDAVDTAECSLSKDIGYKSYENILNKVTYFRGEAYLSGVVFAFKGGIESNVYPVSGIDDMLDSADPITNGIYRFPDHAKSPLMRNDKLSLLSMIFNANSQNNSASQTAINYYLENKDWFDDNLIGFYFVRSERLKNMKYQGLFMYGCRAYRAKKDGNKTGDYPGVVEQFEESATLFTGGSSGEQEQGGLPQECSNITYDLQNGNSYYNTSDGRIPKNNKRMSLIKDTKGGCHGEYAIWLGQDCSRLTDEDRAHSSFWGAASNEREDKVDNGGKQDAVHERSKSNNCFYNDQWENSGEEDGLVMPIWKGFFPNCNIRNKSDERKSCKNYHRKAYYVEKKYGFISPDYLIDRNSSADSNNVVKKLYDVQWIENVDGRGLNMTEGDYTHDKDTYPWWWKARIFSYNLNVTNISAEAKLSDISKYIRVSNAKNGFVSEYTDPGFEDNQIYGFSQTSTCMWHWYKDGNKIQGAGNRSMSTCKYIGVTFSEHVPKLNLSVGSIYNIDPLSDELKGSNLAKLFDFKNAKYKKISKLYTFAELETNTTYTTNHFKGDCFLQQSYFKQMAWRGNTWNIYQKENEELWSGFDKDRRESSGNSRDKDDYQKTINFGHGLVVELITENEHNIEARHSSGNRTFYPKCGNDGLKSFAVSNPDTTDKTEALLLNAGYNVTMPLYTYSNYNFEIPFINEENETRIRYSDKMIIGSFVNSLRIMRVGNYKDFERRNGQILRCFNHLNSLVSYQENAINLHYTGERRAEVDSSVGSLMIGTGEVLESEVRILSNSGIQHKFAAVQGDRGILSLDWKRRTLNLVSLGQVGTASALIANNYTKVKMISSYIYDLCEGFNKLTDAKNEFPDLPLTGIGISGGYDRKYGELYLSIKYNNVAKTLMYNEDLDFFVGEVGFVSPFYLTLNNDFYSVFWNNSVNNCNKIYRHDIDSKIQTFYGTTGNFNLSVIVNGLSEDNNTVNYSKRFASLEIEASEVGFTEIKYNTLKQIGIHDSFDVNDSRFWIAPTYAEGKWKFPIQSQTNGSEFYSGNEYNNESEMRGEWLKININYNGNERQFIKSIITNYEISNF